MVKVSIGLRSAELEGVALPEIVKIPLLLKKVLIKYFTECGSRVKFGNLKSSFNFYFQDIINSTRISLE